MAENGRARSALIRNLPKKGWAVDGNAATFQDLKLDFGETTWIMLKDGAEVSSGEYGRTQMADVKKASIDAGTPFEGGGSAGGPRKPAGGGDSPKAKQAAARARRAAAKAGKEPDAVDDPEG